MGFEGGAGGGFVGSDEAGSDEDGGGVEADDGGGAKVEVDGVDGEEGGKMTWA